MTWSHATINLSALAHNLNIVKQYAEGCQIVAMVKADAYGHGAVVVSKTLQDLGVKRFGVITPAEGVELRKAGISGTILLAGGSVFVDSLADVFHYGLTPLVSSFEELRALATFHNTKQHSYPTTIHLDIDTGMSRGGFVIGSESLDRAVGFLKNNPLFDIEGLCTHFACSEEVGSEYSIYQLQRFRDVKAYLSSNGIVPRVSHVANSGAIVNGLFRGVSDWVRPGILLYGINPCADKPQVSDQLQSVLSLKAPIVAKKRIAKGTSVGYGCTHIVERDSDIVIIGVGYADGYKRILSNKSFVIINGQKMPVIGRISMDLTAVDITNLCGDIGVHEATLIGSEGEVSITVSELASLCETIPYEILTSIGRRVKRLTSP